LWPELAYISLKNEPRLTADGVKIVLYAAKIERMDTIAIRIMTPACRGNVEWRCGPRQQRSLSTLVPRLIFAARIAPIRARSYLENVLIPRFKGAVAKAAVCGGFVRAGARGLAGENIGALADLKESMDARAG
jgi:hypothetical protein